MSTLIDRARRWAHRQGLRRSEVATVRSGPGRGLKVGRAQASADYRPGTNELPVQEAVWGSLGEGDVFFDVGSNVGFFALIAARRVGAAGASYAFEPVPANLEQIADNAARNALGNVTVLACAVADSTGTATLYLDSHPGGATLSAADLPSGEGGEIDVEVVTIDGLVADGRCRPPDVVKIDVEGVEPAVLRGMERTLAEHRPVVICEVDGATRARAEEKVAEVTAMLEEQRYLVERLPDSYVEAAWEVVHLLATPAGGSAPH